MNIIWSDRVIFLLLAFFLGTSMCVDNMPVCENDKQRGERQPDSIPFSGIAPQIRHIRIWHSRLCFFTSLRATERLLSWANTQQQNGKKQEILGCPIWQRLQRACVKSFWAEVSLGIREGGCSSGSEDLLPVKIKNKLRMKRDMGIVALIGICS